MRFVVKTLLSYHAMRQLTWQRQLNAKDTYIHAIFWDSEQLAAKVDILEFENKGFIEALKVEKKKRNRVKQLNLLGEENNGPQLFLPSCVRAASEFAIQKKMKKEQHKKDIEKKKKEK